ASIKFPTTELHDILKLVGFQIRQEENLEMLREENKGVLLLLAFGMATMSIQTLRAGVYPPGAAGLVASLSAIILLITGLPFRNRGFLWILDVMIWVALTSLFVSYVYMIRELLSNRILMTFIVLFSVVALPLLVHKLWLGFAMVREQRFFGCRRSSRR
ncbi:hypothetical protein U1Q18_028236, partial [Sarracenia purpurea var. burkii]